MRGFCPSTSAAVYSLERVKASLTYSMRPCRSVMTMGKGFCATACESLRMASSLCRRWVMSREMTT